MFSRCQCSTFHTNACNVRDVGWKGLGRLWPYISMHSLPKSPPPYVTHVTNVTRPSRFSACNIEKLGRPGDKASNLYPGQVSIRTENCLSVNGRPQCIGKNIFGGNNGDIIVAALVGVVPTYARRHTNGVSCRQLVYLAGNTSILVTESHQKSC